MVLMCGRLGAAPPGGSEQRSSPIALPVPALQPWTSRGISRWTQSSQRPTGRLVVQDHILCEVRASLVTWRVFFPQNPPVLAGEGAAGVPLKSHQFCPCPDSVTAAAGGLKKQAFESFCSHTPDSPASQVLPPPIAFPSFAPF